MFNQVLSGTINKYHIFKFKQLENEYNETFWGFYTNLCNEFNFI